jgi:hypothetical protein
MGQKQQWKKWSDYSLYRLYIENTMIREILSIIFWIIIIISVFTRQKYAINETISMLLWLGLICYFFKKIATHEQDSATDDTSSSDKSFKTKVLKFLKLLTKPYFLEIYKSIVFIIIISVANAKDDSACSDNIFTICKDSKINPIAVAITSICIGIFAVISACVADEKKVSSIIAPGAVILIVSILCILLSTANINSNLLLIPIFFYLLSGALKYSKENASAKLSLIYDYKNNKFFKSTLYPLGLWSIFTSLLFYNKFFTFISTDIIYWFLISLTSYLYVRFSVSSNLETQLILGISILILFYASFSLKFNNWSKLLYDNSIPRIFVNSNLNIKQLIFAFINFCILFISTCLFIFYVCKLFFSQYKMLTPWFDVKLEKLIKISFVLYICLLIMYKLFSKLHNVIKYVLLIAAVLGIVAIILTFLGIIDPLKLKPESLSTNNPYSPFKLLKQLAFYIVCLVRDIFVNMTKNNGDIPRTHWAIMIISIIILIVLIIVPATYQKILTGKAITVDNPKGTQCIALDQFENDTNNAVISSDVLHDAIIYDLKEDTGTMKGTGDTALIDYNFTLSFWLYLDGDLTTSISNEIEILNFNNHPAMFYNGIRNEMIFEMMNGERIIYPNVVLQKYNNWVLNYASGNLDIFLNSVLVRSKSVDSFVTKNANLNMLTLGNISQPNLSGKVCNLLFFKDPLSLFQIKFQYFTNKLIHY